MAAQILVVDDYIVNRIILKEIIEETGYVVHEANNGREALNILENDNIDLVLMDIEMPIMNGFEATKAIKHHVNPRIKKIKVIGITAHDINNNTLGISDFSLFDGFISKPFTLDFVIECVNNNLEMQE